MSPALQSVGQSSCPLEELTKISGSAFQLKIYSPVNFCHDWLKQTNGDGRNNQEALDSCFIYVCKAWVSKIQTTKPIIWPLMLTLHLPGLLAGPRTCTIHMLQSFFDLLQLNQVCTVMDQPKVMYATGSLARLWGEGEGCHMLLSSQSRQNGCHM